MFIFNKKVVKCYFVEWYRYNECSFNEENGLDIFIILYCF